MDLTTLKEGTIGEIIVLDVNVVLDGTEVTLINVLRPDHSQVTWTATPGTGTTNISYTLVSGDLDQVGNYYLSPTVDGIPGETARIRVIEEFD